MLLYSPMEQYVIFPIFSFNFVINNVIFYLLIAALISLAIGKATLRGTVLSNNWGILSESLFRTILKMIEEFVGPKFSIYLPLFYAIFHLILFSNLLGLVPYTSTPTVEFVMTLSIAFTLLIGILLIGFLTHKLYLLAIFLPGGTPLGLIPVMVFLEVIAYVFRTISLGLRLAIN